MKAMPVDDVKDGMVIGENVYDGSKLLVGAGTKLNIRLIERLKKEKIYTVKVLGKDEKFVKKKEDKKEAAGLAFLTGLKEKYGTIRNLNTAIKEKEISNKKNLSKNKSSKSSKSKKDVTKSVAPTRKSDNRYEKKPIVIVKKVKSAQEMREEKRLKKEKERLKINEERMGDLKGYLKETKLYIKNEIIPKLKTCSLVKFKLDKETLDVYDKILRDPDCLENLKKLQNFDPYLYEHALYLSLIIIIAGKSLNYNSHQLRFLSQSAFYADLGMLETPKEIYYKNAILKPNERLDILKHPVVSYKEVKKIDSLHEMVGEIVLKHHERADGTGYPRKQSNDDLDDFVKLFSIFDVYHALISDRPYHKAKNDKEAFFTIFMYKGKQFDEVILGKLIEKVGGMK